MRKQGLQSDERYKRLMQVAESVQKQAAEESVKDKPTAASSPQASSAAAAQSDVSPAGNAAPAAPFVVPSDWGTVTIDVGTVHSLSPAQLDQLRAQIRCFRAIVTGAAVPEDAIKNIGTPPSSTSSQQHLSTPSQKPAQPRQPAPGQQLGVKAESSKGSPRPLSPAAAAAKKKPISQPKPPKLVPADPPKPLLRAQLMKEREHILAAKIKRRISFLEDLLPSDNASIMIELRALNLLELQQKVCALSPVVL